MASTNKTPQLGLNQWEPGDEVIRTDFNGDNLAIEAGIEALKARGSCVTGSFFGDATANRAFNLGFKPRFVILAGIVDNSRYNLGLFWPNGGVTIETYVNAAYANTCVFTETGFTLENPLRFNCISKTSKTFYAAFY